MKMDERFLLTWAFGMWTVHAGYMNMFAEQNVHSYVQDKSPRYNYIILYMWNIKQVAVCLFLGLLERIIYMTIRGYNYALISFKIL